MTDHQPDPTNTALEELAFDGRYRQGDRVLFCRYSEGFFANCTVALWNILEVARKHHCYPARLDFSEGFSQYRQPVTNSAPPVDLYPLLFKSDPNDLRALPLPPSDNVDQHGIYREIDFAYYNVLTAAYFLPSDRTTNLSNRLSDKYAIDLGKVVLVWYRGTDKRTEVSIAEPEEYLKQAEKILNNHPDFRVWIQTEDANVRALFSKHFGDRCIVIEELPPSRVGGDVHNLPPEESGVDRLALGMTLLALATLGAKARYVICHTGNIAFWLCLFRGHTQGVQQFDRQGVLSVAKRANRYAQWLKRLRDRLTA